MACRIVSGKNEDLTVSVLENKSQLDTLEIPSNCLPADFVFGVNGCGKWTVSIHSLVDSKTTTLSGKRRSPGPSTVEFSYGLLAGNGPAEATLDNLVIGLARQESKTSSTPFRIDLAPQFDPVQAGWKKVFDDPFDGQGVDPGQMVLQPYDVKKTSPKSTTDCWKSSATGRRPTRPEPRAPASIPTRSSDTATSRRG